MNKNGWQVKSLSEVLETLESGGRPKGGGLSNGDIPSLGAEHLNDQGKFNFESVKYVPKEYYNSMRRGIIAKNDILVVKDGATTGKVSIVKNDFPFNQAAINEHLFLVRTNKNLLDPLFAFYFLYSSVGNSQIMTDFRGSAQGGISREFINKVSIPLPQLPIQKQIAEILEKADQAKQKRKEANKLTDEFLRSVFIEMFGDPVKNPKGWENTNIQGLANKDKNAIKAGPFGSSLKKECYVEKGFKIYGQEQIIRDDLMYGDYFISRDKYQELKNYAVQKGDVLISLVGTYGKISIVPERYVKGIINPRLMKISLDQSLMIPIFFKYYFKDKSFQKMVSNFSHGGTMDIVNIGILKSLPFIKPPIILQQQFAEIVNKTEALKEKQKQSEQELRNLFQSLMQKAFKGELVS